MLAMEYDGDDDCEDRGGAEGECADAENQPVRRNVRAQEFGRPRRSWLKRTHLSHRSASTLMVQPMHDVRLEACDASAEVRRREAAA